MEKDYRSLKFVEIYRTQAIKFSDFTLLDINKDLKEN